MVQIQRGSCRNSFIVCQYEADKNEDDRCTCDYHANASTKLRSTMVLTEQTHWPLVIGMTLEDNWEITLEGVQLLYVLEKMNRIIAVIVSQRWPWTQSRRAHDVLHRQRLGWTFNRDEPRKAVYASPLISFFFFIVGFPPRFYLSHHIQNNLDSLLLTSYITIIVIVINIGSNCSDIQLLLQLYIIIITSTR